MNLILYNGSIYTMDENTPKVEAIAFDNKKVEKIGSSEDILKLKTEDTRVIDLEGKTVIPGLNDSHMHLVKYAIFKNSAFLGECENIEEYKNVLKDFIKENDIHEGDWVIARGWNQDYFDIKEFPEKKDLDEVSTKHPIITYRACGHIVNINSKGLEVLGIDEKTPQVEGGDFNLETGIFKEAATALIEKPNKDFSKDELKEMIYDASFDLLAQGITSIHTDDLGHVEDGDQVIQAYIELAKEGKLPVRVYEQNLIHSIEELENFVSKKFNFDGCENYFKLGPIKVLADGALGARTAYLTRPYKDDSSTRGIPVFTQEQLDKIVSISHDNNFAVAIHAIGDAMMYSAFESILKSRENHEKVYRDGIVHCQITDKKLLEMYKNNDVLAYIQPIFLHYDLHIVADRIDKDLLQTSYAFKTMMDMGIKASLGTDSPVEPFDTIPNIHCAVNRQDLNKYPEGGFYPEENMTVQQAIYAYTVNSAYSSYDENIKGKLVEGMLGDFTVFDKNIFEIEKEDILDTNICMTGVDGKIVFEA